MYGNPSGRSLRGAIYVTHDKRKNSGQLVLVRNMVPPINHVEYWRYIRQRKQMQINKDVKRENTTIIYYDYRVGDTVMANIKSVYK